jgi:adenylate cyclase
LRWLFVIAWNSSFTYRGKVVDVGQVSRELGLRYVLEGSIRRSGNRIRVTRRLIDATTGNHVWAEKYDRDLADIFAVQDEITQAVAAAIGPAIDSAERQRALRKPPDNLGAWEAYQRGMWHLAKHDVNEALQARTFFQRAIDLDPNFAPFYSALALTYTMPAGTFNAVTFEEGCRYAEPLVRKAVAIDGNDAVARARLALVLFLKRDLEGALTVLCLPHQSGQVDPRMPQASGRRLVRSGIAG